MVRVSPSEMALKRPLTGPQIQSGGGLAGEAVEVLRYHPEQSACWYRGLRDSIGLTAL
ncbi:protein of unknown function [Cupriavidus taiwanensis]|uniref:Uncharacterized protein n=1 Tax=Cupriavidus taiwanensis TaxID=164546 RepID=A0A375IBN3_9BURK|nr:protein of unknown function [Cupriavidus taiwanensis]